MPSSLSQVQQCTTWSFWQQSMMTLLLLTLLLHCTSGAQTFDEATELYERGDYAAAFEAFRVLAEQGDARAQTILRAMYAEGRGVPQDDTEAVVRLARLVAKQGDVQVQYMLGLMYDMGEKVQQDYTEAVRWYRLAAEQGEIGAQYHLGLMYAEGRGVQQDYTEAVQWYRLAAEQGEAGAQFNLGFLYFDGLGVPQDYVQAHKWLNLSASRFLSSDHGLRDKVVKARNVVESMMTPAQIAEAQRLAREWRVASDD